MALSLFLICGSGLWQVDLVPLCFTLSAPLIKFILSLDAYPSFISLRISVDLGRIQGKMVSGNEMRSPLCSWQYGFSQLRLFESLSSCVDEASGVTPHFHPV